MDLFLIWRKGDAMPRGRVAGSTEFRNVFAVLSLEDTAGIAFERGLIPSPSKQNVLNLERSAFRKIRAAMPELQEYLEDIDGGGVNREEHRGRHMAARGM